MMEIRGGTKNTKGKCTQIVTNFIQNNCMYLCYNRHFIEEKNEREN